MLRFVRMINRFIPRVAGTVNFVTALGGLYNQSEMSITVNILD